MVRNVSGVCSFPLRLIKMRSVGSRDSMCNGILTTGIFADRENAVSQKVDAVQISSKNSIWRAH